MSAAAGILMDSDKALAVLPAGTMNLFARSLGVPLDLDQAVEALAHGRLTQVDVASANGRPFVHQYSVGMHPQTVELRDSMQFNSKLGKRWASVKAGAATFFKPPRLKVALVMKDTEILARTSSISVTNNLYGEGTLPYAENPAGGVLGIYVTRAQRRRDLLVFFLKMAMGRWRTNEQVEIHQTDSVTLRIRSRYKRFKCAIDGELSPLEKETVLRIHKGALKVLVANGEKEIGRS
jgi:diacylglycerol kinase family enzyme